MSDTPTSVNAADVPSGDAAAISNGALNGQAQEQTEGQPPSPPNPDEERLRLAERFDKFAKKESAHRKREREFADKYSKFEQEQARAKEILEEYESFMADPVKFMIAKGKDPLEILKNAGEPEPEWKKELNALKAERQKEKDDREKAENQAKQQRYQQEYHEAMVRFVNEITPDECPYLTSAYKPNRVPRLVELALQEHGDAFQELHGRPPTNQEIRQYLEFEAEQMYQSMYGRMNPPPQSQEEEAAPGRQATQERKPVNGSQKGPPSLSNVHASQQASGRAPPKTKEERKRELIARLEAEAESNK